MLDTPEKTRAKLCRSWYSEIKLNILSKFKQAQIKELLPILKNLILLRTMSMHCKKGGFWLELDRLERPEEKEQTNKFETLIQCLTCHLNCEQNKYFL